MKILLAVDGSPYTKKMLAYLVTHDSLFTASHDYNLLTVQVPFPARIKAAVGGEITHQYHAQEAEKILAPCFKFLVRHGLNATTHWKLGHPGVTVSKIAEAGEYDMVIMGSHGHGALVNLVTGSVATQVLAQCKVPVLLIR